MGTWVGSKKVAVLPCIALHPGIPAPPVDFMAKVQRRIFFDPDPNTGIDRSLRRYLFTVSYGRAVLDAEVLDPVTINWRQDANSSDPADPTVGAQIADSRVEAIGLAQPRIANYEFVMVIFPKVSGVNFLPAYAFFENKNSYMFLDNPIGAWAMELLHIATGFGDLYIDPRNPLPDRPLTPGNLDEMDTAGAMHPSTFTKLSMGWLDANSVQVVDQGISSTHIIHPLALLQPPPPGRSTALKIPLLDRANHYLLVESREWVDDYDRNTSGLAEGVPMEGVTIYDVDESISPPLWLRGQGLIVGDSYIDDSQRFRIDVTKRFQGGGFQLTVQPLPEPQRCTQIRSELADAKAQIRDLQAQLHEPGANKPDIVAQIKELNAQVAILISESTARHCRI